MVLMDASEAMECCARAMDEFTPAGAARINFAQTALYAIYQAASVHWAATRECDSRHHQTDPRIPVPSWLTEFQEDGSRA